MHIDLFKENYSKNFIENYFIFGYEKDIITILFYCINCLYSAEKEKDLVKTQVGKPAPDFTLQDNFGKTVSLNDFKGKVIYIDVWASWCGPCRDETPALKLLYEKYKKDSRVAFISVAARDVFKDWKKALEEDKPEWIQLIDKEDVVWKSYTAYSIPNFVLVDKQGNILNIDAPRPSSGVEIEKLIDAEILK